LGESQNQTQSEGGRNTASHGHAPQTCLRARSGGASTSPQPSMAKDEGGRWLWSLQQNDFGFGSQESVLGDVVVVHQAAVGCVAAGDRVPAQALKGTGEKKGSKGRGGG